MWVLAWKSLGLMPKQSVTTCNMVSGTKCTLNKYLLTVNHQMPYRIIISHFSKDLRDEWPMIVKPEFKVRGKGRKKGWLHNEKHKEGVKKTVMKYMVHYKTEWPLYPWIKCLTNTYLQNFTLSRRNNRLKQNKKKTKMSFFLNRNHDWGSILFQHLIPSNYLSLYGFWSFIYLFQMYIFIFDKITPTLFFSNRQL